MKIILYCLLIIAAVLTVVYCGDKDDKELTLINLGLYEIEFNLKYGGKLILVK